MTDAPRLLGYCTNVHAGETYDETRRNLERYAVPVKALVSPDEPLGIGLWLSARAARELRASEGVPAFGDWLDERGLDVFTLNGFPAGDFHRDVVKHAVYEPNWCIPARLEYTGDLAHILAGLRTRRGSAEGSISTLPLGWSGTIRRTADHRCAAAALRAAVGLLQRLEDETGVLIHLDLEPEPGCALQRAADVVSFVREQRLDDVGARRHLRVCHDVCHAAVMFEDQRSMLDAYDAVGLAVGKVQISSAVAAPFGELDPIGRNEAWRQLRTFREPRYLHQTVRRAASGDSTTLIEDLPQAMLNQGDHERPDDEWRVHFHVPIDVETFGRLRSTRDQIDLALDLFADRPEVRHFEIETYAWDVLPPELAAPDLVRGIAREWTWLRERAPEGFFP